MNDYSRFKSHPMGALKDPLDPRDIIKAASWRVLPSAAMVIGRPDIMNQGQQSSCTGHAAAWFWQQVLSSRKMDPGPLSTHFTWYYARKARSVELKDDGAFMRDAIASLSQYGTCLRSEWPSDSRLSEEPGQKQQDEAALIALPFYERCESVYQIRYSIGVENQSVMVGIPLTNEWYSDAAVNGVQIHDTGLSRLGGHAMAVCGYDDKRGVFTLANSWGTDYALKGYVEVSYDYFDAFGFDAWTAGFDAIPDATLVP